MGIKFPTHWKTLIIKFPPPRDDKGVKCPGYARGGMLKLRFDRYIMSILNLRNDQNIGKYENIAEWRLLLAKKVQVNTA